MPKKTKKQKRIKRKSPVKKKSTPVKSTVHENIRLLKKLEENLSFLTDKLRKFSKTGKKPKLSFFLNSENETEAFLIYGAEKVYYWGKLKGKTFVFDRGVPYKFLPEGKEKINLSKIL